MIANWRLMFARPEDAIESAPSRLTSGSRQLPPSPLHVDRLLQEIIRGRYHLRVGRVGALSDDQLAELARNIHIRALDRSGYKASRPVRACVIGEWRS